MSLMFLVGIIGCSDADNRDEEKSSDVLSLQASSDVSARVQTSGIVEIEGDQFGALVLASDKLVLVDFWAEWCLPCLELEPLMPDISNQFGDQLLIAKINIDDHPDLVAEYVTDTIYPYLILMKKGEVLDFSYGTDPEMEPKEFLVKWVSEYLD
jgi:thioredoxin 1